MSRGGTLVPVIEQEEIDELFQAINQEREHNSQEELLVRFPNCQRRRIRVRRRAQVLHAMSTAVEIQPRIPFQQLDGIKGAVWRNRSLQSCKYFNCLNHEFGAQKRREECGVDSGEDTTSESGLDSLPDYDKVEASVDPIPGCALVGERSPTHC